MYITLRNRRHLLIGHIFRHNDFVVKILEGAISGKKTVGRPGLQYLKRFARNTGADNYGRFYPSFRPRRPLGRVEV
jgi:hypothetical protein